MIPFADLLEYELRTVLPIIVGVIGAAIAAATGNLVVGIIFGLVMGAMTWGALYKSPDKPTSGVEPTEGNAKAAEPASSINTDASQLGTPSHCEIGTILAMSVAESLKQELGQQELLLLEQASVDVARYNVEMHYLRSASAFMAAGELISNAAVTTEVKEGFVRFWNEFANSSPQSAASRDAFQQRFPIYAQSAQGKGASSDPDEFSIGGLSTAFAGFLARSAGRAEPSSSEIVLSMTGLPQANWDSMRLGARQLFERAGIALKN